MISRLTHKVFFFNVHFTFAFATFLNFYLGSFEDDLWRNTVYLKEQYCQYLRIDSKTLEDDTKKKPKQYRQFVRSPQMLSAVSWRVW
jgi:hypothetical protein